MAILLFAMSSKELQKQVERRVGQCVLTCPTTAVYAGIAAEAAHDWLGLGRNLRYFGDGCQISKLIDGVRYWRMPVMDGEFVCEEKIGLVKGDRRRQFPDPGPRRRRRRWPPPSARWRRCASVQNVIMPFPGGVVRSGSKVGSKYTALPASTNDAYCPTLRGLVRTQLRGRSGAVLEIVIDGLDAAEHPTRHARRDPGRLRARRASAASQRSPPATTAASSGRTTSTCSESPRVKPLTFKLKVQSAVPASTRPRSRPRGAGREDARGDRAYRARRLERDLRGRRAVRRQR